MLDPFKPLFSLTENYLQQLTYFPKMLERYDLHVISDDTAVKNDFNTTIVTASDKHVIYVCILIMNY